MSESVVSAAEAPVVTRTKTGRPRVRRGKRYASLQAVGLLMVAVVVGFCVFYPIFGDYHPYRQDLSHNLVAPFHSSAHWLGTDNLGRDIASRLALAGRVTLSIVLGIIVCNAIIGTTIGVIAGYFGGKVDNVLMGLGDVQLALPIILLMIALAAALGSGVWLEFFTLAFTWWVAYARVARAVTMSLRHRDFVLAPKIQGASTAWILRKHILPNLVGQIFILASSDVAGIGLLTSSIDYLGLGVQPPMPSWGLMIADGQRFLRNHLALSIVPGVAVFLVIAGVNLASQRFTAPVTPRARRRPSQASVRTTISATPDSTDPARLRISDLTIVAPTAEGGDVVLVEGVDLAVRRREVLCLVGESGSGKSITMLAALGLLPPELKVTAGTVEFNGIDLLTAAPGAMRRLRGQDIAMVFQDPMTALNPVKRVGTQIARTVRLHQHVSRSKAREQALDLLDQVGVPQARQRARAYPHQWSGGMRQRAVIAMAIANSPSVLVADEPTTALDVTVQAQVMDALAQAREVTHAAMVLITHDLGLVAEVADRVAIMYSGRIVEEGTALDIFERPSHPYTQGLLAGLLTADNTDGPAFAIPGSPPQPQNRPSGCAFAPRCTNPARSEICTVVRPVLEVTSQSQQVACHHPTSTMVSIGAGSQ